MTRKRNIFYQGVLLHVLVLLMVLLWGCHTTKQIPEGQYLLRANSLKVKSDKSITNKGLFQDQLNVLVIQKTNTYWSNIFPFKLWRYNLRAHKYMANTLSDLPKSVERPVIYDSALRKRTETNMMRYLFNQGYFNASVEDTVKYRKKKAFVTYQITTGLNYIIDRVAIDADDTLVAALIEQSMAYSLFTKEQPYTKSLADEERSRIITYMQNRGYYKFSQDNIAFELDTLNKEKFKGSENLIESAINFITLQKRQKKHSVDIKTMVRFAGDSSVYQQYRIGKIIVFPDFIDQKSSFDSGLIDRTLDGVLYRFNKHYVREQILHNQIFIRPGELYSRKNQELTINKLNELGLFQIVNIYYIEDTLNTSQHLLNCYVTLSPSKKSDITASLEIANATTYILGNSVGLSYRDRNFFHGANLFNISLTGGLELGYDQTQGTTFTDHLKLQSNNFGVNTMLVFPKFLSPYKPKWIDKRNLPRTQLNFGVNMLDRINQFRLTNISSSFIYNWRQTNTQSWNFSPVFANIVLPVIRSDFQAKLDSNEFLRNSYRRTFIEGENLYYTFTDQEKKQNKNYNYIRVGVEEAGLLMSGINAVQKNLTKNKDFIYDQYVKLDIDARRYFNARHSLLAMRFLAGIGSPYGESKTLPYIKQYFVGGPYSIRGWRPRTLGPVSNSNAQNVDRTGDIKLEMSAEYRFDMIQLFSGTLNLNGAFFADAGNVWLAKKADNTPNGDFDISRLGQDIAMSTGAGLRVIVAGFFTARLDAAFPIKNPYILQKSGWVLNQVDLGSSEWRRQNVVLNVAIGMPF